ncbi:MAG TPA: LysR family transcriptional regulator [Hyphomicrobiaceae bacterium]|nr:LysR family transcriptional regulator [Hyphomicrobiaceae bacterium]
MNFKHLQTFVTICECGTVSRAAAQLRITQPALSRRIEALQNELSLRLFDNRGRRLLLTSEGKEFLRHSRALLAQAEAVLATGRALGDGRAGVLRVGGAPHTLAAFFPSFVTEYEKQNPNVRVRLFEAGAAKLLTMIEHGELHFAVTLALGHDHLAKQLLPAVQLLTLTAPRSPYGGHGRVEVASLRDVPLLVMPPGYATRETFDAACRIAGVRGSVVFESAALNALAAFAEAGHGVAVVPATFRRKGERVRIGRLELRRKPVTMPLAILWDSDKPLPRFAEKFPAMFLAHVRALMRDDHNGLDKSQARE